MCPRCFQPTHVVDSRPHVGIVNRVRVCGLVKRGAIVGKHCGLRFTTVEMVTGSGANVQIKVGKKGILAEVQKRR